MMMSPRGRTLSDSMDYDDELAELHAKRERQLRLSTPGSVTNVDYNTIKFMAQSHLHHDDLNESDEDTEDASEDGDIRNDEHQEIKEQVYHDKLALFKTNLEELEAGNHIDFIRKLYRLEQDLKERREMNAARNEYEMACIERDYNNERLLIVREFEDKKIELRESLITELEEKKKNMEMERYSLELTSDPTEAKPMNTRKLRRRPNEPVPIPEKRRKTPQSQITFLLDDKEIDEDLKAIHSCTTSNKRKVTDGHYGRKGHSSGYAADQEYNEMQHTDTRIEDGKLFYEKRWFHRGQPVFVEGKELSRIQGVISSISQDLVWVRKVNEQTKIRVTISALQKGKMLIKRRA